MTDLELTLCCFLLRIIFHVCMRSPGCSVNISNWDARFVLNTELLWRSIKHKGLKV